MGGGVVGLMILFAILFVIGIPSLICVVFIGIAGTVLVVKIYKMSHKYGEHGMMKAIAKKQIPKNIKVYSRKIFIL
ncbi:hypothetical protein D3C85_1465410 [compost metagenome]